MRGDENLGMCAGRALEIATEFGRDDRGEVKEERTIGSHTLDQEALIRCSLLASFRLFTLVSASHSGGVLRQRRYFTSAGTSENNAYARDSFSVTLKHQSHATNLTLFLPSFCTTLIATHRSIDKIKPSISNW